MNSSLLLRCYIIMILLIAIMCVCIYQIVTILKKYKEDLKESEVNSYIKLCNSVNKREKESSKTI
ncbi:hypothetical protein [uncultured Clostridium sp.]|uniref:hypothetical protein n=1 Tax=uncultured Clostridium sp. TaxID=59620 RepID=UPI0025E38BF6|nr:hypothetical protein [uncultured Clostridium sp.]